MRVVVQLVLTLEIQHTTINPGRYFQYIKMHQCMGVGRISVRGRGKLKLNFFKYLFILLLFNYNDDNKGLKSH